MNKRRFLKVILELIVLIPVLGKSWAKDVSPGLTTTQISANEPNFASLSPSDVAARPVRPSHQGHLRPVRLVRTHNAVTCAIRRCFL